MTTEMCGGITLVRSLLKLKEFKWFIVCTFFMIMTAVSGIEALCAAGGLAAIFKVDEKILPDNGMHGVFITTVGNLDFPSKPGLPAAVQKKQADKILDKVTALHLNTIYLQVRPTADALYKSKYYPWSSVLTGKQGKDPGYDPLAYFIAGAHSRGLRLVAWVNPYRVQEQADTAKLSATNPAVLHPDWVVRTSDGQLCLNPGIPQVRSYIENGVLEIVKNYAVDGIIFDDYFYPETNFADTVAFSKYGGGMQISSWRRDNVNKLIYEMHQKIKKVNPSATFGVSPAAIWANEAQSAQGCQTVGAFSSYYDQFADTRLWVKNNWVDFICPQIYWAIGQREADYEKVLSWWANTVKDTHVAMYVAHAVEKVGGTEDGWQSSDQIVLQLCSAKKYPEYKGSIFFSYSDLCRNSGGVADSIKRYYSGLMSKNSFGRQLSVSYPSKDITVNESSIKITGTSDKNFPLTLNGVALERGQDGYFCKVCQLKHGKNVFTFHHKGQTKTVTVTYDIDILRSVQPTGDISADAGSQINITAVARADATVYAQVGKTRVSMSKTDASGDDRGDAEQGNTDYATFAGTYTIPKNMAENQDAGRVSVTALWGGYKKTVQGGNITISISKVKNGQSCIATLKTDLPSNTQYIETYLYADKMYRPVAYPQLPGAWDYVEINADGTPKKYINGSTVYYKLSCGLMLPSFNLEIRAKHAPPKNEIHKVSESQTGDKRYTEFTFDFTQKITYNAATNIDYVNGQYNVSGKRNYTVSSFNASSFSITFYNTSKAAQIKLADNPMISAVDVSQSGTQATYKFTLKSLGKFYGTYIYYNTSGQLVCDFKNPWDGNIKNLRIAIDAGHGGFDYGAVAGAANEKTINLAYALAVRDILIKNYGLNADNIYMTRTTDTLIAADKVNDLQLRTVNMINFKPDLSLCIHQNDGGGEGFETYYFQPFSQELAASVQANLAQAYRGCGFAYIDRGYKFCSDNAYYSCRQIQFPSILTECGFIDNTQDRAFLTSDAGKNAICAALAKSAVDFANIYMK